MIVGVEYDTLETFKLLYFVVHYPKKTTFAMKEQQTLCTSLPSLSQFTMKKTI